MRCTVLLCTVIVCQTYSFGSEPQADTRTYDNRLVRIEPKPLLDDFPEYVAPVNDKRRYEAPALINDPGGKLRVRAWRYSYNARAIVEIPNRLESTATAIVVVHPWGIDDSQGWVTPQPAGVAFQCTPEKNTIVQEHARRVINPLLKALRNDVGLIVYSMRGARDPIRTKLYRSIDGFPSDEQRRVAKRQLKETLKAYRFRAHPLPSQFLVNEHNPAQSYFQHFPGLNAGSHFNGEGFWELPVPVMEAIDVHRNDLVYYDPDGYPKLRDFMKQQGIRHILLAGYNTDMCVCSTTAGYENLRKDFNVILLGDATIATFPASSDPSHATNAAVCKASLELLISQCSWIATEE